MKLIVPVSVLAFGMILVAAGCDDGSPRTAAPSTPSASATAAEALPPGLLVTAAPADAKGVAEVRGAADGEEVVVRGRIAGQEQPFTEGRAQFQLVDLGVRSCAEMPDDKCPTPW